MIHSPSIPEERSPTERFEERASIETSANPESQPSMGWTASIIMEGDRSDIEFSVSFLSTF
jgi:hypothetical protein